MTPAQPPLPTAWNLPFHPLAGSHTSTLMSESLVGVSVAATRQNSGRPLYGFGPRAAAPPGGANCPAGTSWASVTLASLSAVPANASHVAAATGLADRHARNAMVQARARLVIDV